MTVAELIERLKALPQDALIYTLGEGHPSSWGYDITDRTDIDVYEEDDGTLIMQTCWPGLDDGQTPEEAVAAKLRWDGE